MKIKLPTNSLPAVLPLAFMGLFLTGVTPDDAGKNDGVTTVVACEMAAPTEAFTQSAGVANMPSAVAAAQQASLENEMKALRDIGTALYIYSLNNDGKLPNMGSAATMESALDPYMNGDLLLVKEEGKPAVRFVPNAFLTGRTFAQLKESGDIPLVYGAHIATDGTRAVLFANGKIEQVPADRWTALSRTLRPAPLTGNAASAALPPKN